MILRVSTNLTTVASFVLVVELLADSDDEVVVAVGDAAVTDTCKKFGKNQF